MKSSSFTTLTYLIHQHFT